MVGGQLLDLRVRQALGKAGAGMGAERGERGKKGHAESVLIVSSVSCNR